MKNAEDKINSQNTKTEHHKEKRKLSPFGHLFRIIALWFGFTSLYSMFAVCPCCGRQSCPVGLASAGTFGVFLTLCFQDWKTLFTYIRKKLIKKYKPG